MIGHENGESLQAQRRDAIASTDSDGRNAHIEGRWQRTGHRLGQKKAPLSGSQEGGKVVCVADLEANISAD